MTNVIEIPNWGMRKQESVKSLSDAYDIGVQLVLALDKLGFTFEVVANDLIRVSHPSGYQTHLLSLDDLVSTLVIKFSELLFKEYQS